MKIELKSEMVASVEYVRYAEISVVEREQEHLGTLTVTFNTGAIYDYSDVPATVVGELAYVAASGASVGRWMKNAVMPLYSYTRVQGATKSA